MDSCGTPISESAEQDARMPNNLGDAGRASLGIALRRTVQRCGVVRVSLFLSSRGALALVTPNLRPYECARRAAALRQLPLLTNLRMSQSLVIY